MVKNRFLRTGSSLLALLLCSAGSLAEVPRSLPEAEQSSAWFLPSLAVNEQPICAEILRAEKTRFLAPDEPSRDLNGLLSIRRYGGTPVVDPDVETFANDPYQLALTLPDKSKAFVYFSRYPGCGGACETESVMIGAERHGAGRRPQRHQEASSSTTAASVEWRLYKAAGGDFYVRGVVDHHSLVYRATAGGWELSCDVPLRPKLEGSDDPGVLAALQAIQFLKMARGQMSQGAGACGSLNAHWLADRRFADELEEALYRPWAAIESGDTFSSGASHRDYASVEAKLQLWSLGGLVEYRAFAAYQVRLAQSIEALARFYAAKFGWPRPRAAEMATAAVKGAISRSFAFSSAYVPFTAAEASLRRAILARRPVAEMRTIEIDFAGIDREGDDSILNVAIEHPEALRYLLEQGVSPNTGNAFGKTPLMYAAQYNRLEAAHLLLLAGADPNAATVPTPDTCYFTLGSSGVTPLHYAVRYASAPMIELLIKRGAVTFGATSGNLGSEYPIDRLNKHGAGAAADERNLNINPAKFTELLALLAVPSDAERQDIAAESVERARADYARGNAERAYRGLKVALIAQPDNKSALADLPLIALRAGHISTALRATERATQVFKDPPSLAAAWFNRGLVCEHILARSLEFGGCERDWIRPFVTAYTLQPTAARANKLRALFTQGKGACSPTRDPERKTYRIIEDFYNKILHIYAFHRGPDALDPGSVELLTTYRSAVPYAIRTTVVEHWPLGDDAITKLDSRQTHIDVIIDGESCGVE